LGEENAALLPTLATAMLPEYADLTVASADPSAVTLVPT
jgi:hypothetical protein